MIMFDFLLAPENFAFSTALVLMLLIGAVETLGFGFSAVGADLDAADGDVESAAPLLEWLGFGRLPLLMLVVVALASFALAGITIQLVASKLAGELLTAPLASLTAALVALPMTALITRLLARILPADETTAVHLDSLVGRRGRIVVGTAVAGSPARARVRDAFGQSHYLLVEPNLPGNALAAGDEILLVGRDDGHFRAIAVAPHIHLSQGEAA
jgi:hypothetical protein